MPGMMDTVLNLGLTDETVKGLEHISGNPRFAWDSYRRFCQCSATSCSSSNLRTRTILIRSSKFSSTRRRPGASSWIPTSTSMI